MAKRSPESEERPSASIVSQLAAAWQNGVEIARFGGFGDPQSSPHKIVSKKTIYRLRHYFPDAGGGPAILLVPPLMITAEVWDVSPDTSAVATLHRGGVDPWVIDFGSPEEEKGGLARTLTDHVVAVSEAVDTIRAKTGRDVHLAGYSQGGMFCYQAAAYRESDGLASLVTFGSPVDLHKGLPPILPTELAVDVLDALGSLQSTLFPSGIPSWATRLGFQLLDPVKAVKQRVEFALKLYDRETLQRTEGMRRFLGSEGWVAFPGPALRDFVEQLIADNRLLQGGLVIAGSHGDLGQHRMPDPDLHRRLRFDRAGRRGARHSRRRAARQVLRGPHEVGPLRLGGGVALVGDYLADGGGVAALVRR